MRPATLPKSMRFAIKLLAPYVFLVLIFPSNSLGFGKIIDVQDTARGEVVRDMVFDAAGKYLYISTSFGLVERYNLSTGGLETPYDLGGSLNGLDISPDDSFLLVAQASFGPTEGTLQKVDLSTDTITNINYPLDMVYGEAGVWDVAIASNGLAFTAARPLDRRVYDPQRCFGVWSFRLREWEFHRWHKNIPRGGPDTFVLSGR
jgi:WD40 repeat protein